MAISKKTGLSVGFVSSTLLSSSASELIQAPVWHVFRYRDDRNVGASRKRNGEEADAVSDTTSDVVSPTETTQAAILHVAASTQHKSHAPLEPQSQQQSPAVLFSNASASTPATVATSRYFDPVRDLFRT